MEPALSGRPRGGGMHVDVGPVFSVSGGLEGTQPPEANVKDNGFPCPPPGLLGILRKKGFLRYYSVRSSPPPLSWSACLNELQVCVRMRMRMGVGVQLMTSIFPHLYTRSTSIVTSQISLSINCGKVPTYQSWIRMERFPTQRHPQDHQDTSPAL